MKNTTENKPPVVLYIQHHAGGSGDYRLLRKEYTGGTMRYLTRHILGYYKTGEGVVDKAIAEAERFASGDAYAFEHPGHPVEVKIGPRAELPDEQSERIPERFLDELEAISDK